MGCLQDGAWTIGSAKQPDGDDPDGSEFLLELLTADPRDYVTYARDYFEVDVPLAAVTSIYNHVPLSGELVVAVNADMSLDALLDDVAEINYPVLGS